VLRGLALLGRVPDHHPFRDQSAGASACVLHAPPQFQTGVRERPGRVGREGAAAVLGFMTAPRSRAESTGTSVVDVALVPEVALHI